jgi:hypothetical protein
MDNKKVEIKSVLFTSKTSKYSLGTIIINEVKTPIVNPIFLENPVK